MAVPDVSSVGKYRRNSMIKNTHLESVWRLYFIVLIAACISNQPGHHDSFSCVVRVKGKKR